MSSTTIARWALRAWAMASMISDAAVADGELEAGHLHQELVPGEMGEKVSLGRHAV
jgi:hypothetical protein